MNHFKRIIVTSISCILFTCSLIYAEPIKFTLDDGTLWQGDTDTEIKLTTKTTTKIGNIVKVGPYHIDFKQQMGKIIPIERRDIIGISDIQIDTPTSPPLNQPSKTEAWLVGGVLTDEERNPIDLESMFGDSDSFELTINRAATEEEEEEETIEKLPVVYTIPLTGQVGFIFGEDDPSTKFYSSSIVSDCFVIAKRKKVKAVILDITSNGGYLNEANIICALIQEYRPFFEIIAYPHQVSGSACGIVMTCDTVVVSRDTKFGPDKTAFEKNHLQRYCRNVDRETSIAIALEEDKNITYSSSELVDTGFASREAQSIGLVMLPHSKNISFKSKVKTSQRSAVKAAQRIKSEIDLIWSETYGHKHRLVLDEYCLPWRRPPIPDKFTISEMMDELICREKVTNPRTSERYVRDTSLTAKNIREIIVTIRQTADRIVKGNASGNYPFQLSQSYLCIVNTAAKFGEEVLEGPKIIENVPRVNILLDQFTKELKKCKK